MEWIILPSDPKAEARNGVDFGTLLFGFKRTSGLHEETLAMAIDSKNFNALQSIHSGHYPKMALGTATVYLYCIELMAMCYLSKHSLPMGPAYGDFSHGA